MKAQFLEALKSYAEEKGFTVNEALIENLEIISGEMLSLYSVYADMFGSSYFKNAANVLDRYMPLFKWALIGLAIFELLTIIVKRTKNK